MFSKYKAKTKLNSLLKNENKLCNKKNRKANKTAHSPQQKLSLKEEGKDVSSQRVSLKFGIQSSRKQSRK